MKEKNILTGENWKYLIAYLEKIDSTFSDLSFQKDPHPNNKILGNTLAFQEEVGEFTSEIRKFTKMMFNQQKLDAFQIEDLEDEGCDVLITLLLTLKACGVNDLNAAIQRKIEKNNKRGY